MWKTAAYFLSYIALGMVMAVIGPTLPGLAEQTKVDLSRISYLFTSNFLGYLLGALFIGRLFDSIRGHRLMIVSLATMAGSMAAVPFIPGHRLLVGLFFLLGMASGNLDVGCNTLTVRTHKQNVGPLINGLHFCFALGQFLSPFIIAWILRGSRTFHSGYRILAIFIAIIMCYIFFLKSPGTGEQRKAGSVSKSDRLVLIPCVLFLLLHVGAQTSYGGWIVSYAIFEGLAEESRAAYLAATFFGLLAAGRLIAVFLSRLSRPVVLLLIDLAGCMLGAGAVLFFPRSIHVLWIGTMCEGLAMASIFPVTLHFIEEQIGLSGTTAGWVMVGSSIGGMSFPMLVGQLFESRGPHIMFVIVIADLVLAVCVLFAMAVLSRKRKDGSGPV
ncbi:MAG: MFS transporter [Spirochaetes bacterium]|nr:MFS transporter [Spirochaetota bacterium]